jgi:hypothetical protein
MSLQIYTYEQYKPAYPQTGNFVRLFRGTFEANRDYLSPSMVYARDFYADSDQQAEWLASRCALLVDAEFEGFEFAD